MPHDKQKKRHITGEINPIGMGRKERKREERIALARKRMRLHSLLAIWLLCLDNWERAYAGTHKHIQIIEGRSYMRMQLAQLRKKTDAVVKALGPEWPRNRGGAFFVDAQKKIDQLLNVLIAEHPADTSFYDIHVSLTYVISADIHDLIFVTKDNRELVRKLDSCLTSFANHMLKNDSPYILPMNSVYRKTHALLQEGDPPPDYGCQSEIEVWLLEQGKLDEAQKCLEAG